MLTEVATAKGRKEGLEKSMEPSRDTLKKPLKKGARFESYFVGPKENPYDQVKWVKRSSKISGADGEKVFEMKDIMVPEGWSQLATDIAVSKYFRKAGVPGTGHEVSARQLVYRIAHALREAGQNLGGYFKTIEDAQTFEDELLHLLITQKCAFNSPVWFNCGLHLYDIKGSGGNWAFDPKSETIVTTKNAYDRPQCSAR